MHEHVEKGVTTSRVIHVKTKASEHVGGRGQGLSVWASAKGDRTSLKKGQVVLKVIDSSY
jgi:hypothetical protein